MGLQDRWFMGKDRNSNYLQHDPKGCYCSSCLEIRDREVRNLFKKLTLVREEKKRQYYWIRLIKKGALKQETLVFNCLKEVTAWYNNKEDWDEDIIKVKVYKFPEKVFLERSKPTRVIKIKGEDKMWHTKINKWFWVMLICAIIALAIIWANNLGLIK